MFVLRPEPHHVHMLYTFSVSSGSESLCLCTTYPPGWLGGKGKLWVPNSTKVEIVYPPRGSESGHGNKQ